MLHSKIMGRARCEDKRPKQKFFGGEYAILETTLVYVQFSVWTTSFGCPRWSVSVTTNAPHCTSAIYDNGSWVDQDHLTPFNISEKVA